MTVMKTIDTNFSVKFIVKFSSDVYPIIISYHLEYNLNKIKFDVYKLTDKSYPGDLQFIKDYIFFIKGIRLNKLKKVAKFDGNRFWYLGYIEDAIIPDYLKIFHEFHNTNFNVIISLNDCRIYGDVYSSKIGPLEGRERY